MLRELFEAVQAQAVAHRQDIVAVDAVTIGIRQVNGTVELQRKTPEPRQHTALSLESLVAAVTRDGESEGQPYKPAIWFSRHGVVGFYDDGDRRDRVTMPLGFSPQLLWLLAMDKQPKAITQRDLIFTLRTLMKRCLAPAGRLIEILRQVDFKLTSEGGGTVGHGKVSIGKQMRQEMSGADVIPEYVVFSVPIFASSFDSRINIECALEPDPATQSFQIVPIAGAIEGAIEQAEQELGTDLKDCAGETAVFYGLP